MEVSPSSLRKELRKLGYECFRPGQEWIVREVLAGRDVLGVLPTGSGKSLTYQLASGFLPGVTLVVSPLIALMQDQVDSLRERDVEAGMINSTRTASQTEDDWQAIEAGETKLLYVTPERFENEAFMARLAEVDVSLLVIDEAQDLLGSTSR